jgi:hypothetical protein
MPELGTILRSNEKFAFVALRTRTEILNGFQCAGPPALWVSVVAPVELNEHWKHWLGTIETENFEHSNLFLIAKTLSSKPNDLDAENHELINQVSWFHAGLLLSARFATFENPLLLTGAMRDGFEVRQVGHATKAIPILGLPPEPLTADLLMRAATIASALQKWGVQGGSWRFNRVLSIYLATRANPDPLERIHQFSRCLEGLILPETGNTRRQFVSRTETFVGPKQHDLMRTIYDVRSAVEHLHEYRLLEPPNRAQRIELLRKAAITEYLSRRCLGQILLNENLWPHFSSPSSLAAFWDRPPAERKALWGPSIDMSDAIVDFCPRFIRDEELGLE